MPSKSKSYQVLGLMSGSSLDGLDIAWVEFGITGNKLDWSLKAAETLMYNDAWKKKLRGLPHADSSSLQKAHADFGHYSAELVNTFIKKHKATPDFIASHGHTIFHYPSEGFTTQIGDGASLAAGTGLPVICDFRTLDVALGGEGAPLAPVADKTLFPGYDFYLNLGGIANITSISKNKVIAFDVCPANQVLNYLSEEMGLEFDARGVIAKSGQLLDPLLDQLASIDFYQKPYPKTLDNNWIRERVFPVFDNHDGSTKDKLHTACKHVAQEISRSISSIEQEHQMVRNGQKLLITGGGGFNDFLVNCIRESCEASHNIVIVLPSPDIIAFKEALLMALMGILRLENQANCFMSVTGARSDSISGAIYQGTKKLI